MMGYQIILVVMFVIGIGVEANPMERCLQSVKFNEEFDSIINLASEEQLNLFCGNMTNFFTCMNGVIREETGFNLKELASLLEGTDIGKAFRVLVNVLELVEDICTEGTELHAGYLANAECYRDMPNNIALECEQQAKDATSTFLELQREAGSRQTSTDEPCIVAAYQLGCLGADVREQCGEEGFETYKKVVKKMGFFKSGLCSSELLNTFKTDFLDNLEISDDKKSLFRVILDLKRRRR